MRRKLLDSGFIVCLVTLVLGTAGLNAAVNAFKLYLRKLPIEAEFPVRAVPAKAERWAQIGKDGELSEEIKKTLGTENYLTRLYLEQSPSEGKPARLAELHLAYYTGMVDTVPHVPERCMIGQGFQINTGTAILPITLDAARWRRAANVPATLTDAGVVTATRLNLRDSIRNGREVTLPFDLTIGDGTPAGLQNKLDFRITDFVEPKTGKRVYSGYFFVANGRIASSAEQVRLLAFNLTDDYAYYLKVQVSSSMAQSAEELAEIASSLLSELFPEVMMCVPDWVKVRSGTYQAPKAPGT